MKRKSAVSVARPTGDCTLLRTHMHSLFHTHTHMLTGVLIMTSWGVIWLSSTEPNEAGKGLSQHPQLASKTVFM